MRLFAIPGYGIPADMAHDENYRTYLHVAFNTIIARAGGKPAIVTLHGGPTNCTPPFKGTEAAVMATTLRKLASRPFVKPQTKQWSIVREVKSLSTLQNILYLKEIADAQKLSPKDVTVFCEWTRERRIRLLARKIFGRAVEVVPIDFDVSESRYGDWEAREADALQGALWALQSPENLVKEREFFRKKMAYIRILQHDGMSHVDAVMRWYEYAPQLAAEIGYGATKSKR